MVAHFWPPMQKVCTKITMLISFRLYIYSLINSCSFFVRSLDIANCADKVLSLKTFCSIFSLHILFRWFRHIKWKLTKCSVIMLACCCFLLTVALYPKYNVGCKTSKSHECNAHTHTHTHAYELKTSKRREKIRWCDCERFFLKDMCSVHPLEFSNFDRWFGYARQPSCMENNGHIFQVICSCKILFNPVVYLRASHIMP